MITRRHILAVTGGLAALAAAGAGPGGAQELTVPTRRKGTMEISAAMANANAMDQTKRFTAFRPGASGLLHRRSAR